MIFQKGDLVKLDVGVHIKGALGDNALTVEVGMGESILSRSEQRERHEMQLSKRCTRELHGMWSERRHNKHR